MQLRIGVLCGSDDNPSQLREAEIDVDVTGNCDALRLLRLLDPERFRISLCQISPNYLRQALRWNFGKLDLVWNIISDVDDNPATLAVARKLLPEGTAPVVNLPAQVVRTRRHEIAERLQGIEGVRVPKVLLLRNPTLERMRLLTREADFRFPAIVRRTGAHTGEVVGVFDSPEAVEGVYGDRRTEYYVTEYVDVRRPDGLYRKTRFFFIGEEAIVRQHIVHDDWNIHGGSSREFMGAHEALLEESRRMLVDGFDALPAATREAVQAVRRRIGLDYFGLDAYLDEDGGLVVFECNATMNFNPAFRNPKTQHNRAALPRAMGAIERLILTKTGAG